MAGFKIRKHEVDRLMNVAVVLGWELVQENYLDDGVQITIVRKLTPELLKLDVDLDIPTSPQ